MGAESSTPSVVLLGEPLVVLASDPVALEVATQLQLSFGGSEFNTAVGLARLGLHPRLATSVGTDVLSRRLTTLAVEEGVTLVSGESRDKPIGAMFKDRTGPNGQTFYLRNGSAFSAASPSDFVQDILSPPAAWFHTSGISWAVNEPLTRAFMQRAAESGARVSFDVNLRPALHRNDSPQRMFDEIAQWSDVLLLSRHEALAVTGASTVDEAVGRLADSVARAVIRNGVEPLLMLDGGVITELPVVPMVEVDPIGAGDAFNAGFIAGTLHDMGMKDSCRLGAELAGEVVGLHGDWGFAPRHVETSTGSATPRGAVRDDMKSRK